MREPIRALHSVGSLNRGGIETWMMNVLRQRHPELKLDFILHAQPGESGDYEREALAAGCAIYYYPPVSRFTKRMRILGLASTPPTLCNVLRSGHYDVFHVHGTEFNGDAVKEAHLAGTPVRVAHCHSTRIARGKGGPEMWLRWGRYLTVDRARLLRHATDLVACGRDAGRLMVGRRWDRDPRCQIIYCGIDISAFEHAARTGSRAELLLRYQLPLDAIVIGHAGSMGPSLVKNHEHLVRVFAELAKRDPRYYLFMAGDGPLKSDIAKQVISLGLTGRVRMPGLVSDVPGHMCHLFDAHVLPSLFEGLPVVAIEAAAAGLYSVLSDTITNELSEHLPGRTDRLSLKAPLSQWADRVAAAVDLRESPVNGLVRVRASPFSISQSAEALVSMYRRRLEPARQHA